MKDEHFLEAVHELAARCQAIGEARLRSMTSKEELGIVEVHHVSAQVAQLACANLILTALAEGWQSSEPSVCAVSLDGIESNIAITLEEAAWDALGLAAVAPNAHRVPPLTGLVLVLRFKGEHVRHSTELAGVADDYEIGVGGGAVRIKRKADDELVLVYPLPVGAG